jgi:hypothetical protein
MFNNNIFQSKICITSVDSLESEHFSKESYLLVRECIQLWGFLKPASGFEASFNFLKNHKVEFPNQDNLKYFCANSVQPRESMSNINLIRINL